MFIGALHSFSPDDTLNVTADKCRAACLFILLSNAIHIHKSVSSIAHHNYLAFIRMQGFCYLHNATEESHTHVAGFVFVQEN